MRVNYTLISILTLIVLSSCGKITDRKSPKTNKNSIWHFINDIQDRDLRSIQKLQAIDSIYSLRKNYPIDSLYLTILQKKSNFHFALNQLDSTWFYDKLLQQKSRKIGNDYFEGKANVALAFSFKAKGVYDSAYFHYNASKNNFQKLKDSSQVGRRLLVMGIIQQYQNDNFGSKETITEALSYLDAQRDSKYFSSCLNSLGINHRKLLNYDEAIKYHQMAILRTNSSRDKLVYKNNLAATLLDAREFEKAISLLKEISEDSLLLKDKKINSRVLDNLAYAEWKYGIRTRKEAFLTPLEMRKELNDKRGQIASYTHLGEFYCKINKQKAASYFDSVIQLAKTIKMPRAEKDALKFRMGLDTDNIQLRDRYIFLQDSLQNQDLKVKTQFAKYKYDDKRKQEKILRLEKENTVNELKASRQQNQKILYLGGLVFLASALGFLLFGFKQRTKRLKQISQTEKLAAIYETEAEMSRLLHDDHGGKLTQTMLMVENEDDKAKIMDNLEALYDQTRDLSRQINEVDTGPNFWEHIFAMIQLRTPSNVKLFLHGGKEVNWQQQAATVKTVVYKIIQELMINLGKHSNANTVAIAFQELSTGLKINYADDGIGASQEELRIKNGLRNTEKRIEAIGGSVIFESEKENGFKVEIHFPK